MTASLDLQSERFPPTGGIDGEGASRTIGRPRLDPLVLMIREVVQNSWDAKIAKANQVRFHIDAWTLNEPQRRTLESSCFAALPTKLPLGKSLKKDRLAVVVISDRNTVGLAGPTRADAVEDGEEHRNFVAFFRNIGRESSRSPGGGTYGFGKASLYYSSHARTILAYTRFSDGRSIRSRLMAAALGKHFTDGHRNYTGRHWWGRKARDGIVDPLTDSAADSLAAKLGMPTFKGNDTGTSIMIVDPALGAAESLDEAMSTMCDTALWYAWPRMAILEKGYPEMKLGASLEGQAVPTHAPESHPRIREFIPALRVAVGMREETDPVSGLCKSVLQIQRPIHDLGTVAVRRVLMTGQSIGDLDGPESLGFVPVGVLRHVALLRKPRLVVRYVEFAALPAPNVGFAGVFLADDKLNRIFADAEPVTHDEWNAESLENRTEGSIVRVALRRIGEFVNDFCQASLPQGVDTQTVPLGSFSRLLGGLLPDTPGTGAESAEPGERGGGRGSPGSVPGPRVEILAGPDLRQQGRELIERTRFRIVLPTGAELRSVRIRASVRVVVAGGAQEGSHPTGASDPRVVGWEGPGISQFTIGRDAEAVIEPQAQAEWSLLVHAPSNSITQLRILAAA